MAMAKMTFGNKKYNEYRAAALPFFDRFGKKVYKATSYTNDWDGTANSKPLPQEVLLRAKCNEGNFSGSVTIVR